MWSNVKWRCFEPCAAAFGIMFGEESLRFRRRTKRGLHNKRAAQPVDSGFHCIRQYWRVCGLIMSGLKHMENFHLAQQSHSMRALPNCYVA